MKFLKIIFVALLSLVLFGLLLRHFIDYDNQTEEMMFTALFTLVGIGYIGYSFKQKRTIFKGIFILSGVYLIIRNFIPEFNGIDIIGIFATLIPIIISWFNMKIVKKGVRRA